MRLKPNSGNTEAGRRERILDAAENAFADFGFDGASLRHIVLDAGVNLATVYYYFGSKEGLMSAVVERRFGPLREQHLTLLRQFERDAQGGRIPIEQVLEAMLVPPLRLAETCPVTQQAVTRLIGRIVTEPNPQIQELVIEAHREVRVAFLAAMRRSLPDATEADLRWRLEFTWGALALILCNPGKLEKMTDGVCNPADTPTLLAQMLQFFGAGFRAPSPGYPTPPKRPVRKPRSTRPNTVPTKHPTDL